MTNYARGDRAEKIAAARLRDDGYAVWQARGSHGAADLIAVKPGETLLCQVKSGSKPMSGDEWNRLYTLAVSLSAVPLVADFPRRGHLRFRELLARHIAHSKTWYARDWQPDQAAEPSPTDRSDTT